MDNAISDDELAALGLSLEDFFSSPSSAPATAPAGPEPAPAAKPAEKVMTQADIDALIASMNM